MHFGHDYHLSSFSEIFRFSQNFPINADVCVEHFNSSNNFVSQIINSSFYVIRDFTNFADKLATMFEFFFFKTLF